jgi:hypothetical protein
MFRMALAVAIAAAAAGLAAAESRADVIVNQSVPIEFDVLVPCAAGGAGEVVHLTGQVETLLSLTSDGAGGFHLVQHVNPQGVVGTGLTTGDSYRGTGVTSTEANFGAGLQTSFVNNFRLISSGSGVNFLVHENENLVVGADGTVKVGFDHVTASCG